MIVRRSGKWLATPLLLALIAVELSDILFAVDSVPAVLAITRDAFIAYSSNVFAILGLRSLYFALARILPRFRYIHQGLADSSRICGLENAVIRAICNLEWSFACGNLRSSRRGSACVALRATGKS